MRDEVQILDAEIVENDTPENTLTQASFADMNVFCMWQKYACLWAKSIRMKIIKGEARRVTYQTPAGVCIDYDVAGEVISDRTRREYIRNTERFFVWLRDNKGGSLLSLTKGGAALEYAAAIADKTPATQAAYLGAPRRFFEWARNTIDPFSNGFGAIWGTVNPFNGIEPPQDCEGFKHDAITAKDAAHLIATASVRSPGKRTTAKGNADARCGKRCAERDALVCSLAVRLGLRCVEIARLNCGDVDLKNNRLWVLGKVGASKIDVSFPKADTIKAQLKKAIEGRSPDEPLITSQSRRTGRKGEGVKSDAIQRIIRRCLRDADLWQRGRVTPHSLRHTAETLALIEMKKRDGVADIRKSAQLLRHSEQTAKRYAHDLERKENECAELISSAIDAELEAMKASKRPTKRKRSNTRKTAKRAKR